MLQPDFYSLLTIRSNSATDLEATLLIHPEHSIFAGHFPGQPVVPGVCMLQMITDCLERVIAKKLVMASAANIKFLSMLVPEQGKEITLRAAFSQTTGVVVSNASISAGEDYFIKLSNAHYYSPQPA